MNNKSVNLKSNSGLSYKGKVSVKIKDGKRTVFSKKLKNNGKWPLFLFFAQCLTGKYSEAESQRPNYIQLYNVTNTTKLFDTNTTWNERSSAIKISTSPAVNYINNTDEDTQQVESASGTLKFTIPFSLITDKTDINLLVLRSKDLSKYSDKNVCAYIIVDSKDIIPEELSTKEKYILYIDWTLSIQN